MRIKSFFIDRKIKSAGSVYAKSKDNSILSKIDKLAIFVDEESLLDEVKLRDLRIGMKLSNLQINILTYKEKKTSYNEFKGTIVTKKDINWYGKIKTKDIKDFLDKQYDILIDYTRADNRIKQLIVTKINASFKVGYSDINNNLYTLMISVTPKEIDLFNTELVRYLTKLELIK